MNYMVRRTRIARSAIFGRCTIFLITQIRMSSWGTKKSETPNEIILRQLA